MTMQTSNERLNDLLVELHRSLAQYVAEASPWSTDAGEEVKQAVLDLARRQQADVKKIARFLNGRRYRIDFGAYPSEYGGLHFTAIEFLFSQLLHNQKALVRELEASGESFLGDADARQLTQEIAASQRAGLEALSGVSSGISPQAAAWMK